MISRENKRVLGFMVLYFQRCRKEKSCAAFLLFISADWQKGIEDIPSLLSCSGF